MSKITHIGNHRDIDLERFVQRPTFPEYTRDESKYFRFKRGLSLAKKFQDEGRWEITPDDLNEKTDTHQIHVRVIEDDFDESQMRDYIDFLTQFDDMMFFGEKTGETCFVVGINDVYKKE